MIAGFATIIEIAHAVAPATVRLASWNIRFFSTGSRDDAELQQISQILLSYDFVAIMELRDEEVLQRTQTMLASLGRNYAYEVSIPLGSSNPERYAFLYDTDIILIKLHPDLDSNNLKVKATGGGMPPLIIKRADGSIDEITIESLPLGAMEEANYTSEEFQLEKSESIKTAGALNRP